MAYTVTMTFTRPDEDTDLPTLQAINSTNKTSSDTVMADNGVAKTYDIDGLVTKVIYTAANKSTYVSAKALADDVADEATVRATYKTQCESANITCTIVDSDGTTISSF
jgi:hypothetical protein